MSCQVCGSKNSIIIGYQKPKYRLLKCTTCGLVYVNPLPNKQELEDYYNGFKPNAENVSRIKELYPYVKYSVCQLILNAYEINKTPLPIRFLDLAGGGGLYAKAAKEMGCEVWFMDLDPEAVEFADSIGLNVISGDANCIQDFFSACSFDIILAQQIIEHVRSPKDFLEGIHFALKPNGVAILSTPNNNGLEHYSNPYLAASYIYRLAANNPQMSKLSIIKKMVKNNWMYVDPPRHLYAFNQYNLQLLLKKAGLTTKKVVTGIYGDPVYNPLPFVNRKRGLLPDAYYCYQRFSGKIVEAINRGGQ